MPSHKILLSPPSGSWTNAFPRMVRKIADYFRPSAFIRVIRGKITPVHFPAPPPAPPP